MRKKIERDPPMPEGETEAGLFEYLAGFTQPGLDERSMQEFHNYLRSDLRRFLYTLDLVPKGNGRLLEIGAHPYFTTILLLKLRNYTLELTNGTGEKPRNNLVRLQRSDGTEISLQYARFNLEQDTLPFEKETFDIALCCEVIEHMTNDPYAALQILNSSLKQGGTLILTTPNAARFDNVLKALAGRYSTHDVYSAYGPYGRHNREYTPAEMTSLLERAGFRVETSFTADVHPNFRTSPIRRLDGLMRQLIRGFRSMLSLFNIVHPKPAGLGYYLFIQATKVGPPSPLKPSWLYNSYPAAETQSE